MTKIAKLDRTALQNLRAPIEAELAALGERLGLKFTLGNGGYGPEGVEASFKLIMKVDDLAAQEAAARDRWNKVCHIFGPTDYAADNPYAGGLRPEDYGTEFEVKGCCYRTVGIEPSRRKYPILCEIVTGPKKGERVFFTERTVPVIRAATDAAKVPA